MSAVGLAASAAAFSPTVAIGLEGASAVAPGEHLAVVQVAGRCTGTLVAPQVVVYAAHCGDGPTTVRVGPFPDGHDREVRASRCVAHPDGGPGSRWDVALCVLDDPLSEVRPARLQLSAPSGTEVGAQLSVVGFGESAAAVFGVKRAGTVTVRQVEPYLSVDGPAAACEGDSGGPLFVRGGAPEGDEVVGFISATASQFCDGSPARVVRIHEVLGWLEKAADGHLRVRGDPPATGRAWISIPAAVIVGVIGLAMGACVAMRKRH